MTVDGDVTAPAGLLDGDARRVTIEDGGAAVLLRLPDGVSLPAVGDRVRVSGAMGTYYGAPQLAADAAPAVIGHATSAVTVLRRPPAAADEWLLVRVTGTITGLVRSGSAWRAEMILPDGAGSLPIAGLAASGIPSTALAENGGATITGLVRRAYPTATDQRFAIVPRTSADVATAPIATASASPSGSANPSHSAGASGGPAASGTNLTIVSSDPSAAPSAKPAAIELVDLPDHDGQLVLVAGRVLSVTTESIVIDDGTTTASLRVAGEPITLDLAPEVGQVVNAIGTAAPVDGQRWEVVLASLADITTPADVVPPDPSGSSTLGSPSPTAAATSGATAPAPTTPGPPMGGLMLLLLAGTLISAGTVIAWRQHRRRARHDDQVTMTLVSEETGASPEVVPGFSDSDGSVDSGLTLGAGAATLGGSSPLDGAHGVRLTFAERGSATGDPAD